MSCPQTKKELWKLLGAFGYYRDYIEHFAHIVKPLTDLTSKKVPNQLPWAVSYTHLTLPTNREV